MNDFEDINDSHYFMAVTWNDHIYCLPCLPSHIIDYNDTKQGVKPLYAKDNIEGLYPECEKCGHIHNYMNLIPIGV